MRQFCRQVADDPKHYKKILNGLKIAEQKPYLMIEGKGAHHKYLFGRFVTTFVLNHKGTIRVRQSKSLMVDYGFQVLVDEYSKPILRFDADGASHYDNENENLPLLEREIRTPHFHKFNDEGVEIAYKTEELKQLEYEVQQDIQTGMNLFCKENYIQDSDGYAVILQRQEEMFPEAVSNDIHKGVIFP